MNAQPQHLLTYDNTPTPQTVRCNTTQEARTWFETWPDVKFVSLEWESYAWPGGYPLFYVAKDCGILCPDCANAELPRTIDPEDYQFYIIGADVNWEDDSLTCDHCNRRIDPAYGD